MRSDYQQKQSIILDMSRLEEDTKREQQVFKAEMMSKPNYPTLEDSQKLKSDPVSYNSPEGKKLESIYTQSKKETAEKFVSKIPKVSGQKKPKVNIPKLALPTMGAEKT